tara:strand:- start:281 stop:637 length:357 start_codon:yes stop_codon:yes gene_type:complete
VIISFAKTVDELLSGQKVATRRIWKERAVKTWQRAWDKDRRIHQAWDKTPRIKGAQQIGTITLTHRPYLERLGDMPEEDLIAEGGMCETLPEFWELVGGDEDTVVTVVRFTFEALAGA